jgi:hypothetical protein
MAIRKITRQNKQVAELLDSARQEPVILQVEGGGEFAVLPLDDDVIDLLIERNPAFIEECRKRQESMEQGDYLTYEEALRALELDEDV